MSMRMTPVYEFKEINKNSYFKLFRLEQQTSVVLIYKPKIRC